MGCKKRVKWVIACLGVSVAIRVDINRPENHLWEADNFIALCLLHHHQFDHDQLSPEEWAKVREAIKGKMEVALVYAYQVRFPGSRHS
jgi:hypothetical protein